LPSTTREPSELTGRPTDLISSGKLFDRLNIPALSVRSDRVMICGSMAMNQDMKAICEQAGFNEGANSQPAEFVLEKAFVG
jgi:ferredoxin--NADP+ reductase